MIERYKVYAALDGELEYQIARWAHELQTPVSDYDKKVGDFLSYIIGYNADLVYSISHVGQNKALDVFRKLGALCVACLEINGSFTRHINGSVRNFQGGQLERKEIYKIIDSERIYQDELWDDQKHTLEGYIVLFQYFVNRAQTAWVTVPNKEYTLDVIRELAAIAVHAMEDYGVVSREPFEV